MRYTRQRPALPSPHIREKEKQERVKSKKRAWEVQEDRKGKVTGVVLRSQSLEQGYFRGTGSHSGSKREQV